jgi:hypothetical protein
VWIWDFVDMYLTHLGTRIWSPSIHTYSIKWFFGHQTLLYPLSTGKKTLLSTLNLMILQMRWNECVRFGGRINIQVSYKILWLEVQKKASILHNLPCFQEGLFWKSWTQYGHWCLGVKFFVLGPCWSLPQNLRNLTYGCFDVGLRILACYLKSRTIVKLSGLYQILSWGKPSS